MLLVYFVIGGLVLGWLTGGRMERLGEVRIRWAGLAIAGLAIQVALFSPWVAARVGDAGPWIYLASSAAVLAALLRNLDLPGTRLISLGAVLNALVILANGGYMPVSPYALAILGHGASGAYSNTAVAGPSTVLPWLGDFIAVPPPLPLANAISVGDVLIGLGAAVFVVRVMHRVQGGREGTGNGPAISGPGVRRPSGG